MPGRFQSVSFLMLGACACCNFRQTQEVYLDRYPTKANFTEGRRKLLARHSSTGCKASMIAIGLTKFAFEKFNVLIKFAHPLEYYLYGE